MTSDLTIPDMRLEPLEELAQALEVLSDRERLYVHAVLAGERTKAAAAAAAGFADEREGYRVRRRPTVQRAIKAARRLRESQVSVPLERACQVLEGALETRLEDLCDLSPEGVPIGFRNLESLDAGALARVRSATIRVHRSAKGERAHYVTLSLDLVPALEIIQSLGKLRGWFQPEVQNAIAIRVDNSAPDARAAADDAHAMLDQLADAALDDLELAAYVQADGRGDRVGKLAVLQGALLRLREQRGAVAIPAEASRG